MAVFIGLAACGLALTGGPTPPRVSARASLPQLTAATPSEPSSEPPEEATSPILETLPKIAAAAAAGAILLHAPTFAGLYAEREPERRD